MNNALVFIITSTILIGVFPCTKCDETRPVCNQCTKSRRHCSGYRSNFDILHRDETHKTANRHKRTTEKKAAKRSGEAAGGAILQFEHVTVGAPSSSASASASTPASAPAARRKIKKEDSPPAVSPPSTSSPAYSSSSSPSSSSSSASSSPAAQQQYDFSYSQPSSSTALVTTASTSSSTSSSSSFELGFPSTALAVPIDQHASHYFASHFIMLPGQRGQAYGHLEYLVPLLQTETSPSSPFQLAYSACGLAAMSNRERANHTDLTELSYLQHARASTAIRKALADPVQCRSDATLASVLLLSFFEVCLCFPSAFFFPFRLRILTCVVGCYEENYGYQGDGGSTCLADAHRRRRSDRQCSGPRNVQQQVLDTTF